MMTTNPIAIANVVTAIRYVRNLPGDARSARMVNIRLFAWAAATIIMYKHVPAITARMIITTVSGMLMVRSIMIAPASARCLDPASTISMWPAID